MKNQVIKCLSPEHGKKIIEYWKSKGVDTKGYKGVFCESGGYNTIYYGVINDSFTHLKLTIVNRYNAEIIELPEIKEDREIIGYKLKEDCEQYRDVIETVLHNSCSKEDVDNLAVPSIEVSSLRRHNVLDLWYDPVYAEGKFNKGDYVRWEGVYPTVGIIKNREYFKDIKCYRLEKVSGNQSNYNSCNIDYLVKITKEEYDKEFIKLPIINGCEGSLNNNRLKYGRVNIYLKTIEELYGLGIKEATFKHFKINREEIKQILDYTNNQYN